MSSYLTYYLAWTVLAYATREPALLAGIVLFLVLRPYIPDPGAIWRALGRSRSLASDIRINPANLTARRQLAVIYLDLRRPRAALALVDEALARLPDDPELLFLRGLALQRAGRHEEALAPLVRAVELRPKLLYGEPFAAAGDALLALDRAPEAIDAYERFARINHSDVRVHVQLARAFARTGQRDAVRDSLARAVETWGDIPGAMRRRAFGHWLEAWWLRARLLGDPTAIAAGLALVVAVGALGRVAWPHVGGLRGSGLLASHSALLGAYGRCGTQSTGDFQGRYVVDSAATGGRDEVLILRDRIRLGRGPTQEYCPTRTLARTATSLRMTALWHEDVDDPGDASQVEIRLDHQEDRVVLTFVDPTSRVAVPTRLRRAP